MIKPDKDLQRKKMIVRTFRHEIVHLERAEVEVGQGQLKKELVHKGKLFDFGSIVVDWTKKGNPFGTI